LCFTPTAKKNISNNRREGVQIYLNSTSASSDIIGMLARPAKPKAMMVRNGLSLSEIIRYEPETVSALKEWKRLDILNNTGP
jgi:hypothetical protein